MQNPMVQNIIQYWGNTSAANPTAICKKPKYLVMDILNAIGEMTTSASP